MKAAAPGGVYQCQDCWRLSVAQTGAVQLSNLLEFSRLRSFADRQLRYVVTPKAGIVVSVEEDGIDEAVYCCTVENTHSVSLGIGITTGQCGEIVLSTWGGYCQIGDICLAYCTTPEQALDAVGMMAKFLVRTSLMRCDYEAEVLRTNRIGVALTGIHEFAWNLYGLTFLDMIDYDHTSEHKAHDFWEFIGQLRIETKISAWRISNDLGLVPPHTVTTIKPSGCRPWYALTTTTDGILTLEELFIDHQDGEQWSKFIGKTKVLQGRKTASISRTYVNGVQPVYRIKMNHGLIVESTGNHPWWVNERYTRASGVPYEVIQNWVKTEDIKINDILQVNLGVYNNTEHSVFRKLQTTSLRMRMDCSDIIQPIYVNEDIAWLLGYLWGDGTLSPLKYRIRFIDQNRSHVEKAERILFREFGLEGEIKRTSEGRDAWVLDIGSKILWFWLMKNGVSKYDSEQLELIPRVIRESSRDDIIAFIAGLVDSDGCISTTKDKRQVILTSADERFSRHVQDVAWSVGLGFGMSHNSLGQNLQKRKSMYLSTLSGYATEEAFSALERNSEKIKNSNSDLPFTHQRLSANKGIVGKVVSIELTGDMPTYDIEIEGEPWFHAGSVKSHNTISKVMDCTEGAHLPALRHYLRWVQYKYNDPDLKVLQERGYPVKDISHRYPEYWVVGFPTHQRIVDLMGAENVVTADETTPEQNFIWLQLLERFWLGGAKENNQVSYTLKYDPQTVSYLQFMELILRYQPLIRCCSVMPQSDWKQSEQVYGYVPEQPITKQEYDELLTKITPVSHEGYDENELQCDGACPIEVSINQLGPISNGTEEA